MTSAISYSDSNPVARAKRLADLSLTEELLLEVAQRAQLARASCTLNHPPLFPGISAWAEGVSALRERLLPQGWVRSDEGNLPFTVNRAGTVALTISTGDEATGRKEESPCTKSTKGPRTKKAVDVNVRQLTLFGDIRILPKDLAKVNGIGRMTWILLMHWDRESREVRCELSRPVNVNEEGRVDLWAERIILSATPFDNDSVEVPSSDAPQTPNFVVDVKRRA